MPKYKIIPRHQLKPPSQPLRTSMDEGQLEDLASSIRNLGLLEPLLVEPVGDGFEVIDGHRRLIATQMAGLNVLPCMIFEASEDVRHAMMLHANICREDVTAAEEGLQFLQLGEQKGWSMDQLCRFFRRSENYIQERVDLVQLSPDVAQFVAERKISFAVAKEVRKCKDEKRRAFLLDQAVTHGASVRTIRYMLEQYRAEDLAPEGAAKPHTPERYIEPVVVEQPRCVLCDRDDDPSNLGAVPCHTYHMKDLAQLLEQLGINRVPRA